MALLKRRTQHQTRCGHGLREHGCKHSKSAHRYHADSDGLLHECSVPGCSCTRYVDPLRAFGGNPAPKFKVGDKVEDIEKENRRRGEVSFIGSYDDVIDGYRYRVLESNGSRVYWNEGNMQKIKRSRR